MYINSKNRRYYLHTYYQAHLILGNTGQSPNIDRIVPILLPTTPSLTPPNHIKLQKRHFYNPMKLNRNIRFLPKGSPVFFGLSHIAIIQKLVTNWDLFYIYSVPILSRSGTKLSQFVYL